MNLSKAHKGYTYQDLLISYFILKEILNGHKKSIFHIDKKHTTSTYLSQERNTSGEYKQKNTPDRFDDLVIVRDSSIERKQIKYSDGDTDRKLIKNDFANDSKGLALYEVYRTWLELKDNITEFRLCLAWNEPIASDIKSIIQSTTFPKSFNNFTTKTYKINIGNLWSSSSLPINSWRNLKNFVNEYNINRDDFKKFCDDLIIELEFPKAIKLENILIEQAQKLGIGQYPNEKKSIDDFLDILAHTVSKLKGKHISGEEILAKLKVVTDYGKIEQKFNIDQTKNIKFSNKYIEFENKVVENKKTLLIGEPGSGKSWFLTNFIEYLEESDKKVIRHYCFTDTEDDLKEKRVSSDIFFGNLVADIIKKFPKLEKIKKKLFVSSLDELNLLLSHINENLIIVIDGLDHINRVLKSSSTLSEDKTKIIDFISQIVIRNNITIILGSQPVSEIQILINDFEYIEYRLPKWDIDDTVKLMDKYSLNDSLLDDTLVSKYIFEKSEGNPLYLTYIIKTLINQNITIELIRTLPQYDFNLKNYYEYLIAQINDNLTSEILSCLEFSVTKQELKEIIPRSSHLDNNLKILSPVISENLSRGGIKLYHDSFRRYTIEKLEANANLKEIYNDITKWLKQQGFYKNSKSYRYLLSYYVKVEKYKKVKHYATNDFLTKSLYSGYSKSVIKKNYDNFLYVAKETQDWALFIYISELNRTMQSTLSDSYNEFEERFENYFKGIGLVYGFEKANEMLFFNGEENFNHELIAKAFYISQKNNFTPNWKRIEMYFEGSISSEKFKYYISYLIAINKINEFISEKIQKLSDNRYRHFFKILIEEIYQEYGIDKVVQLVDFMEIKEHNRVIRDINNVLFSINANNFFIIKEKNYLKLNELTLDIFSQNYVEEEELKKLYKLLENYAYQDFLKLKEFKRQIQPNTFLESWVQFSINIFIIEYDLSHGYIKSYSEFENKLINNFSNLQYCTNEINRYYNHRFVIIEPILRTFKYIKNEWEKLIDVFLDLQKTPLEFSFIKLGLFNDFKCKENIDFLIDAYERNLQIDETSSDGYSFLIEETLDMVALYKFANKPKKAKQAFKKAISYTTAYTFRKDTTLDEIIEPLSSLKRIDKNFSLEYTKHLLPLNLTVQNHSEDGKGIRWLYIDWFKKFLYVDRKLASSFLINGFLKEDFFWKYEYMFVDFIQSNKSVDPIILNFLYKLSPTNVKDDYINSFSDNTYELVQIDKKMAKQSLMNILERDLNNSSEQLSAKTIKKLQVLKNILDVSIVIQISDKEKVTSSSIFDKRLQDQIDEKLHIKDSLKSKSIEELNKYFDKKSRELDDNDIIFLMQYINEKNDEKIIKKILVPIIQHKHIGTKSYYEKLRLLINTLGCSDELKVFLLINTFVHSQGGWMEAFVNKESLKDAINIDKQTSLKNLALTLTHKFYEIYYYPQSTANLLIAFEYAGLKKKNILSMYKRGFEFIEYRLPHNSNFEWEQVIDENIETMNDYEVALTMMLSKMRNFDVSVQKEIIMSINYLMNYNCNLLIKPFEWLFEHIEYFPHISITAILELFLLYVDSKHEFFQQIRDDLLKVESLENLTIQKNLNLLLVKVQDV